MIKIFFILFLPLLLFSKYQIVTYFPLESHIIKKIAQNEVKIREISSRFIEDFREIPSSEISKLSNAKIYFHFGLPIEKEYAKLLKQKNSEILIIDLSSNIKKTDGNPYFWTDPFLIREVAKNIYEILVDIDKDKIEYYKKNYESFIEEIDDTFLKVKQKFNTSEVNSIFVFDDYLVYFTRRFRIDTIQREKRFLNASEISELVKFTQAKNIKKIVFFKDEDYEKALSLSSNLNIQLIKNDIFSDNWQFNMVNLAQNLSK